MREYNKKKAEKAEKAEKELKEQIYRMEIATPEELDTIPLAYLLRPVQELQALEDFAGLLEFIGLRQAQVTAVMIGSYHSHLQSSSDTQMAPVFLDQLAQQGLSVDVFNIDPAIEHAQDARRLFGVRRFFAMSTRLNDGRVRGQKDRAGLQNWGLGRRFPTGTLSIAAGLAAPESAHIKQKLEGLYSEAVGALTKQFRSCVEQLKQNQRQLIICDCRSAVMQIPDFIADVVEEWPEVLGKHVSLLKAYFPHCPVFVHDAASFQHFLAEKAAMLDEGETGIREASERYHAWSIVSNVQTSNGKSVNKVAEYLAAKDLKLPYDARPAQLVERFGALTFEVVLPQAVVPSALDVSVQHAAPVTVGDVSGGGASEDGDLSAAPSVAAGSGGGKDDGQKLEAKRKIINAKREIARAHKKVNGSKLEELKRDLAGFVIPAVNSRVRRSSMTFGLAGLFKGNKADRMRIPAAVKLLRALYGADWAEFNDIWLSYQASSLRGYARSPAGRSNFLVLMHSYGLDNVARVVADGRDSNVQLQPPTAMELEALCNRKNAVLNSFFLRAMENPLARNAIVAAWGERCVSALLLSAHSSCDDAGVAAATAVDPRGSGVATAR